MSSPLRELAHEVGVHERTLRRAVSSGLVRARRSSPREIALPDSEAIWVRTHWPLVASLRAMLRTEPSVALAVLFGSNARGDELEGASDVDLLIMLRSATPGALDALSARLVKHLDLAVQLVPLEAAGRDPQLMEEIVRDGRPLVDRQGTWARLQADRGAIHRRAVSARDELHREARLAIDYFTRLASQRTAMPSTTT
jgi:predicted nucleotidyltransferase